LGGKAASREKKKKGEKKKKERMAEEVAGQLVAPGEPGYDAAATVLGSKAGQGAEEKAGEKVEEEKSGGGEKAEDDGYSVPETPGKAEAADVEPAAKHPLQNRWTLWYDPPMRYGANVSWEQNLKKIVTFDTVEDFWRIFNNIRTASKLNSGCDYHLFKDGIVPQWEDPANVAGGKWLASIKGQRPKLDKWWLWTILAVIGEGFESEDVSVPEEITGVVVSIRNKGDRLALWTRTADKDVVMRIGHKFKETLSQGDDAVPTLSFQSHEEAMRKGRSFNNTSVFEV
jgi:translation initiation factor 4E